MKIPTTGKNSGKLFCLQKRITDATKYNQTEEWGDAENYCGGEPKWEFEDCGFLKYSDKKYFDLTLYCELNKAWQKKGVCGFYNMDSAKKAKEIMEQASQNGEFDHRDGYRNLLYRVRHEYRIVSVEFDIKVEVC